VEAVSQKYASEITERLDALNAKKEIEISGKTVEEVGFDKIRKQLAQLDELKIVIVDGMRITHETDENGAGIKDVCPRIVELDLSRNMFEDFREITSISLKLENLKSLRVK
jgi:hypothetical protein